LCQLLGAHAALSQRLLQSVHVPSPAALMRSVPDSKSMRVIER
jgi:hypothetical protein